MIVGGLKLARKGGVALVRDDELLFAAQPGNLAQERKECVETADAVPQLLALRDYHLDDVGVWVLADGAGETPSPGNVELGGKTKSVIRYPHRAALVAAAYCTSPFARAGDPAVVLVLDRDVRELHLVDAGGRTTALGTLADDVVAELPRHVREHVGQDRVNLCVTGPGALDIHRNTLLRELAEVAAVWIPPFPDDSGAAFGAVALHLGREAGLRAIRWDLHVGPPPVRHPHLPAGWSVEPCRPEELARLLHRTGEPVVVISGRAKPGPRALGVRSILAPAVDPSMRTTLNRILRRDEGRAITPLCLAEAAAEVFEPGTPDPYRQFAQRIRGGWAARIPAVAPPDAGALQTVGRGDDPTLAAILREYHTWSGIPVLCTADTAAPDDADRLTGVTAALTWGRVGQVWSDGVLYRRIRNNAQ